MWLDEPLDDKLVKWHQVISSASKQWRNIKQCQVYLSRVPSSNNTNCQVTVGVAITLESPWSLLAWSHIYLLVPLLFLLFIVYWLLCMHSPTVFYCSCISHSTEMFYILFITYICMPSIFWLTSDVDILEFWLSPTPMISRHLWCHLQSCVVTSLYAKEVNIFYFTNIDNLYITLYFTILVLWMLLLWFSLTLYYLVIPFSHPS